MKNLVTVEIAVARDSLIPCQLQITTITISLIFEIYYSLRFSLNMVS